MAQAKKTTKKPVRATGGAVKTPKKAPKSGDFAVIDTGGKQYVVREGQTLKIEKLEVNAGEKMVFDKVLLLVKGDSVSVGTPYITGAKVEANIIEQGRHKKILVVKYKQKSRYFKRNGHRQPFTEVAITSI